jgi:hypothetical protein
MKNQKSNPDGFSSDTGMDNADLADLTEFAAEMGKVYEAAKAAYAKKNKTPREQVAAAGGAGAGKKKLPSRTTER